MKKYFKFLVLYCIANLLLSCSSTGPQPVPVPPIDRPEKLTIKWDDSDLASSPPYQFVPTIDENAIFTADAKGNLFKIDRTDGTVITHFKLKRALSSGTAVSSDSIFVTTTTAYLLSVNKATGKIKWRAHLPTISVETPQVSGNVVLVRTNDSEILAYEVSTGSLLWVYQKPVPTLTLRVNNSFSIVDKEVVAVGQPGGRLVILNITNGNQIWENLIAAPEGATDLDKLTDIAIRPVLSDKTLCVATFNGKIACLDAISSNIIWAKKFSSSYGILIDEQNVYSINGDGVIFAFDKNTGATIWSNNMLRYRHLSVPVFLGNNILVIDNEGYINLFSRSDGKLVARKLSDLTGGASYPWSDGERVFVQSASGNIAEITQ